MNYLPGHNLSQIIDNQIQILGIHEDQNSRKNFTRRVHKLTNMTPNQEGKNQSTETHPEITVCTPRL